MSGARAKYATKAALDRLVRNVRAIRPVDNDAIRFSPDGTVTFLPIAAKHVGGDETWGDL